MHDTVFRMRHIARRSHRVSIRRHRAYRLVSASLVDVPEARYLIVMARSVAWRAHVAATMYLAYTPFLPRGLPVRCEPH